MKDRLHLRVEADLLKKARKLAKKNHMTITAMVEAVLRSAVKLDEEDERISKQALDAEQI
jgi:hypothetical protein